MDWKQRIDEMLAYELEEMMGEILDYRSPEE